MSNFELAVLFCTLFGVATLVSFMALAGKIKFSLRTIFIIVTSACVGFAVISAFGDEWFTVGFWALLLGLPIANFFVVAALFVSVVNTDGETQAIRIGWLTPLVGMAIVDCFRIAFDAGVLFKAYYIAYYLMAYLAAWIGGLVCDRTYRSNPQYQWRLLERKRTQENSRPRHKVDRTARADVPSPFADSVRDEPNVNEIN